MSLPRAASLLLCLAVLSGCTSFGDPRPAMIARHDEIRAASPNAAAPVSSTPSRGAGDSLGNSAFIVASPSTTH